MKLLTKLSTHSAVKQIILSSSITGFLAVAAHASSITWQSVQTISGASDVSTAGTLVGTWSPYLLGDGGGPTTVNGVPFSGDSLTGLSTSSYGSFFDGFGSPGTANAAYNTLLKGGSYGGPSADFSFGGLTVGSTYQVEIWVDDSRGDGFSSRQETFSADGSANDNSGTLTFGVGGAHAGQFVIGTFVADATSEQIDNSSVSEVPQVNLFQLRELAAAPVPDGDGIVVLMVGVCGLGAVFLRLRTELA